MSNIIIIILLFIITVGASTGVYLVYKHSSNPILPVCQNECKNEGVCNSKTQQCDCIGGWTGPTCETKKDKQPCDGKQCLPGQTCYNEYEGNCLSCDPKLNCGNCIPGGTQCKNGGVCKVYDPRYLGVCVCPRPYYDFDCSKKMP